MGMLSRRRLLEVAGGALVLGLAAPGARGQGPPPITVYKQPT